MVTKQVQCIGVEYAGVTGPVAPEALPLPENKKKMFKTFLFN